MVDISGNSCHIGGAELVYFKIAERCNIIDKPNGRSSHTKVVIREGGIIYKNTGGDV